VSERLIIRLGSRADDGINWLVWSDGEQEIIASGTLENAQELSTLSQRASSCAVCVLVPGADVGLFEAQLPKANRRQAIKAIPFMLEDDIAADIESMHFVYGQCVDNKQSVYVVDQGKMSVWLQWLEHANITANQMLPDWLALPVPASEHGVSIIELSKQLLIRQGAQQGLTISSGWFSQWLTLTSQQQPELCLESYGVSDQVSRHDANWQTRESLLPMQRLALGATQSKVNLLVGNFAPPQQHSALHLWTKVAGVAAVAVLLIFVEKFYQLNQLTQKKAAVVASSQAIYRQLNPEAKRVNRLKYRVKQQLKQLAGGSGQAPFLAMMATLNNAFNKVPKIKPVSIKYDNKRQELRIQANADNYQQFEQFKRQFGAQFSVTTGAMNNNGNKVNGSLIIKVAS